MEIIENLKPEIKKIFTQCISKNMPSYEYRPCQINMAEEINDFVYSIYDPPGIMLLEAGTGTGKSLAYLVPLIYWSLNTKKRVLVSTYTKTLQEQIIHKDLPFLEKCLDVDFKYALCLGSENYICLRRYRQACQHGLFETELEKKQIDKVSKWLQKTETGLIMDINFEITDNVWSEISRDPDLCMVKKCPYRSECFYIKARKKQNEADLLITNHHLFFTNLASGNQILPDFSAVVFDEAHNIEEVACQYLGIEVSNSGIIYILNRIYNPKTLKGLITRVKGLSHTTRKDIVLKIEDVRKNVELFFTGIIDKFGNESTSRRIHTPCYFENIISCTLEKLYKCMKKCSNEISDEEEQHELNSYANKILSIKTGIEVFIEQKQDDAVYWIEIFSKVKNTRITLHITPVDISEILNKTLYNEVAPIIFTSATLTVTKKYDFLKERTGINFIPPSCCIEKIYESPFDYKKNVLLYIPLDIEDPSLEYENFKHEAIEYIKKIIEVLKGRTFILFTSYESLNQTYEYLNRTIPDVLFLKQGDMQKWQMLELFKNNQNSILLGTNTFWQGIDVPGRALECVIIFKLPFAVPDDPVTEARIEFLIKKNIDPFIHYQLPQAVIMLKQGFGRLIRTKNDRGSVVILDSRIKNRAYGKYFIESLPECQITHDMYEFKKFFK